jgi:Fe-S-cluster-containing dehydrogenase component
VAAYLYGRKERLMTQYAICTDLNRCVGCLACAVACKVVNDVPIGNYWNKVLRIGPNVKENASDTNHDVEMYYLTVQCQHCKNPLCVEVCPTEASHKQDDGTVQINKEKCIGCQFCVMACPYGVRYLNEEERVVEKCTLCEQITSVGGLPQCVIQCGGRARYFGDLDNGIETFEGPAIGIDSDRTYNTLYTSNRNKLGDYAKPFTSSEVYNLPDVGNHPSMRYIMRDRKWQGTLD